MLRIATLMAVRSHLLANAAFGRFEDSEPVLTSSLWREVPDDSLVLVDRNFLAAGILVPLVRDGRNRHWMSRAKTTTKWTVLESMAPGDDLVELQISAEARSMDPSLPKTYVARAIKYQRKGFQPQTMLTSLTDAKKYPAKDVVARREGATTSGGSSSWGTTRSRPRCSIGDAHRKARDSAHEERGGLRHGPRDLRDGSGRRTRVTGSAA
jgi:hypothetical protein